jgi:hypothetical protein
MLFRETVVFEYNMKHTNTFCDKIQSFLSLRQFEHSAGL